MAETCFMSNLMEHVWCDFVLTCKFSAAKWTQSLHKNSAINWSL